MRQFLFHGIGRGSQDWAKRPFFVAGTPGWAPLDQQFLASMAKFAGTNKAEYLSPFWTNLFFSYLIYDQDTAKMTHKEISRMQNRLAVPNILNGKFSSTGEYYRKLIQDNQ